MRARKWVVGLLAALVLGATAVARAQDNQNAEQLKKMYDDVLQQLNASQERKNQLAAENERLLAQVDALNKEKAAHQQQLEAFQKTDLESAEKTFFLRAHYMAWQQFTRSFPEIDARWRAFIQSEWLTAPYRGGPIDIGDVFESVPPPPSTHAPTSAPASQPATPASQPAIPTPTVAPTTSPTTMPTTAPAVPLTTGDGTVHPATVPAVASPAAAAVPSPAAPATLPAPSPSVSPAASPAQPSAPAAPTTPAATQRSELPATKPAAAQP